MSTALEDLALGDVTLEQGASTVRAILARLTFEKSHELYEALRSWLWKSLESRRRDDELSGWLDVFSRASSGIEGHSKDLAVKLEAFMELLQASIMTSHAAEGRDPLERKHVRAALRLIYRGGGRIRRKELMEELRLKAANLSRVMTPLQDDGFVMREVEGREVLYRLTMKGTELALQIVAHEGTERAYVSETRPKFHGLHIKHGYKSLDKPTSKNILWVAKHYPAPQIHRVEESGPFEEFCVDARISESWLESRRETLGAAR